MTVTVVAVLTARPESSEQELAAFAEVSPLVHAEKGCELHAAHRKQSGEVVVMVERWTTRVDLDAHASGLPLALLNELSADLLTRAYDARECEAGDYFLTTCVSPVSDSTGGSASTAGPP